MSFSYRIIRHFRGYGKSVRESDAVPIDDVSTETKPIDAGSNTDDSIIPNVTALRVPSSNFESIWNGIRFQDLTEPGTRTYYTKVNSVDMLKWRFEWCATNSARLQRILAPLSVDFKVDDITLPKEIIADGERTNKDGWKCHYREVALTDWKNDATSKLAIEYSLARSINDLVLEFRAPIEHLFKIAPFQKTETAAQPVYERNSD